jgi:hypothetical protein
VMQLTARNIGGIATAGSRPVTFQRAAPWFAARLRYINEEGTV